MMQPPEIEVPAQATDANNIGTIENNDTMGELPKF